MADANPNALISALDGSSPPQTDGETVLRKSSIGRGAH